MKLSDCLKDVLEKEWLKTRSNPIDASEAELQTMMSIWDRRLEKNGIKRLKMSEVERYEDLYVHQSTPNGDPYVWNPAARLAGAHRVLLVPKDTAEKILFLGML